MLTWSKSFFHKIWWHSIAGKSAVSSESFRIIITLPAFLPVWLVSPIRKLKKKSLYLNVNWFIWLFVFFKFTFGKDYVFFKGKHDSVRCFLDGINSERAHLVSHSRLFLGAYTSPFELIPTFLVVTQHRVRHARDKFTELLFHRFTAFRTKTLSERAICVPGEY